MIKIKTIIPPVIKLYGPNDTFIGDVFNEYEAADIRNQIAREKLSSYYFIGLDRHGNYVKSNISENGDIDVLLTQWELLLNSLQELTEIKRANKKNISLPTCKTTSNEESENYKEKHLA